MADEIAFKLDQLNKRKYQQSVNKDKLATQAAQPSDPVTFRAKPDPLSMGNQDSVTNILQVTAPDTS